MNKTEQQYQISSRTKSDTALTNNWLKNRGISESDLLRSETLLLQAQQAAHLVIQHHMTLLPYKKREWLNDFELRTKNKRQRNRITDKECYAVLNLAKSINRQVFVQHKQTQH